MNGLAPAQNTNTFSCDHRKRISAQRAGLQDKWQMLVDPGTKTPVSSLVSISKWTLDRPAVRHSGREKQSLLSPRRRIHVEHESPSLAGTSMRETTDNRPGRSLDSDCGLRVKTDLCEPRCVARDSVCARSACRICKKSKYKRFSHETLRVACAQRHKLGHQCLEKEKIQND